MCSVAVETSKLVAARHEACYSRQRIMWVIKVQEMSEQWGRRRKVMQWHMIGHIQNNKVKYMIPYVSLIHSADRIKLFKEINKQAAGVDRVVDVLLQVKIAQEDSKYGMPISEATELLKGSQLDAYPNVRVVGLMGMASFTDDMNQVDAEFKTLESLFIRFRESKNLTTLSMGMSGDYELAVENGSTMIRIGSAIFGERNYL